jgi:drug/metabolite transporter (DMT)-like permease
MHRVGVATAMALTVAVMASSSAAPMIAYAAAPALSIAFWRNALAVGLLVPVAATARRRELGALLGIGGDRRRALVSVLAGVCLAVHFATWVPSAKLTSVAVATALMSTMPVWTAIVAWLRGLQVTLPTWLGIALAVLGVVLATGADVSSSSRAVVGDALALAGAVFAAGYVTLGEKVRASTSTTTYTTVCYSVCSVLLLAVCVVGGVRLVGFSAPTWRVIVALTLGPQLLGHSLINYALRHVSATTVAVLQLFQVPGAALIGWALLGKLPAARSVPGLAIIVAGLAVVVLGARRQRAEG